MWGYTKIYPYSSVEKQQFWNQKKNVNENILENNEKCISSEKIRIKKKENLV